MIEEKPSAICVYNIRESTFNAGLHFVGMVIISGNRIWEYNVGKLVEWDILNECTLVSEHLPCFMWKRKD